jgi:hypothetical protein
MIPFHKIFTYNGGIDREKVKIHAKITREQITRKIEYNLPLIQKYLSKGIDKFFGDCNGTCNIFHNNNFVPDQFINIVYYC